MTELEIDNTSSVQEEDEKHLRHSQAAVQVIQDNCSGSGVHRHHQGGYRPQEKEEEEETDERDAASKLDNKQIEEDDQKKKHKEKNKCTTSRDTSAWISGQQVCFKTTQVQMDGQQTCFKATQKGPNGDKIHGRMYR